MNKITLTLILFVCIANIQSKAQDILIKTNNDSINCVIKEIGDNEIKYISPDISESVLFGIDKNDVSKVVFANGKTMDFSQTLYDPNNYVSDKKHNIKINFLSPLFNSTNICYEKSIRPGRSFETTLGIIGLGWDNSDNQEKGAFVKLGYKFIKSPDYYIKGQRFAHILKGAYIRPEIAISYYKYIDYDFYIYDYTYDNIKDENLVFAVLLNFGKQWVFENGFLVDWFAGVGYGFGKNDNDYGLHKAFIGGINEFPLAATMGLRVGWNF